MPAFDTTRGSEGHGWGGSPSTRPSLASTPLRMHSAGGPRSRLALPRLSAHGPNRTVYSQPVTP